MTTRIIPPSGREYNLPQGIEAIQVCNECLGEGYHDSCFHCGNRGFNFIGSIRVGMDTFEVMPDSLADKLGDDVEEGFSRFVLYRQEDETGVSGTGLVAYGVEFPDGRCVMRWNTNTRSTAVYDDIGDLEQVHGHEGKTKIIWLDGSVE
jgi:hypothetical protein